MWFHLVTYNKNRRVSDAHSGSVVQIAVTLIKKLIANSLIFINAVLGTTIAATLMPEYCCKGGDIGGKTSESICKRLIPEQTISSATFGGRLSL